MEVELVGVLIAAGIGAWVHADALARGAAHPILWGVGAFLLAIVVVPAWLLTRPPKPHAAARKRCPYCAEEIQGAAIVCRHCGRDLEHPPR